MINISRLKDPNDLLDMQEHFVVENEDERGLFKSQLLELLLKQPESLFVVQARRDEELVGFLIAHNTPACVWLAQAWASPTNGMYRVADAMWARVVAWTAALGKTKIQATTTRKPGALHQRFGFRPLSLNIQYDVPSDIFDTIAGSLTHGKHLREGESDRSQRAERATGALAAGPD